MTAKRSVARKLALGLAVVVGAVVLLVVALVVLLDSGVATKRVTDLVLPRVSSSLGREVTLEGAGLKLFPNPRVRLDGLAVAGRAGEPALVEAEALEVELRLWPLLRSLGKEIDVRAFSLVRPSVNLVKAKDGSWNFEGLGAADADAAKPPPPEPAPEAGGAAARVAVEQVRIEKAAIRVVDRTLGRDDAGLALSELDLEATGVGPGLPFDLRVSAALADERQNLQAQLSVDRLPEGVPVQPADWPAVQGSVKLGALALERLRALLPGELGAIVRGGTVTLEARLATGEKRDYRIEGTGELRDLRLRGQPASGRFRATAVWSPATPDAARLELADLAVRGPGVDLGGHASVQTSPMRAWFVLTGPLLDVDALMGVLPEEPAATATAPAPGAPAGELVPEATRRELRGVGATGTVAIAKVKAGRVELGDVKAKATLRGGALTLEQLDASAFGGRISGGGTKVSLAEKIPTWRLAAKLSGVDLAQALTAFAGRAPLLGKVDGTLDVSGAGTEWEKLRDGLTGLAALAVKDGALTTTDLGDQVLGGVSKALAVAGRGGAAEKVGGAVGGRTELDDLSGTFDVKDGFLSARTPVTFTTGAGKMSLGGRIGLDGRLDLRGAAAVPRKSLAGVAAGVPLPDALEVPLGLGGTLSSPSVSVRADEAVKGLVAGSAKRAVQGAKEKATEKAQEAGKKAVGDFLKRFGK